MIIMYIYEEFYSFLCLFTDQLIAVSHHPGKDQSIPSAPSERWRNQGSGLSCQLSAFSKITWLEVSAPELETNIYGQQMLDQVDKLRAHAANSNFAYQNKSPTIFGGDGLSQVSKEVPCNPVF